MNKNPYDVLGVSPEATDDEIKKAYRELSRKYHPDANVDNPLKDLAEEKFKEVQEAYDTIVKERENGGGYHYGYGNAGSYTTGSGSYGNSGYGGAGSTTNVERQAVYNFINNRRYQEALNLLGSKSGRDIDKMHGSGLTPEFVEGQPTFAEAELVFVCKKLYAQDIVRECFKYQETIDRCYGDNDFHTMYIGEIVACYQNQ